MASGSYRLTTNQRAFALDALPQSSLTIIDALIKHFEMEHNQGIDGSLGVSGQLVDVERPDHRAGTDFVSFPRRRKGSNVTYVNAKLVA